MAKRNNPEHQIQVAICELLSRALPKDALFFAVPNGGERRMFTDPKTGRKFNLQGKRLKDEGVVRGVSDLIILWAGRMICLEVKAGRGSQSDAQKEWEARATECGAVYRVVRSTDEVREFLTMVIPTFKARLGESAKAAFLSGETNDIDDGLTGGSSPKAKAGDDRNKAA